MHMLSHLAPEIWMGGFNTVVGQLCPQNIGTGKVTRERWQRQFEGTSTHYCAPYRHHVYTLSCARPTRKRVIHETQTTVSTAFASPRSPWPYQHKRQVCFTLLHPAERDIYHHRLCPQPIILNNPRKQVCLPANPVPAGKASRPAKQAKMRYEAGS